MPTYKDQSGRSARPAALRVRGLALGLVVAAGSYGLYQSGIGSYAEPFQLTLVTKTIGEGMAPGAEVKYRGYNIGSVKSLWATGFNQQRMTVILDARQARVLTADTKAQFTSSNIFGTAAVELISSGTGPALKPGQVLEINSDIQAASITGFLRQGQRLGAILDTPEFNAIIQTMERHSDLTAPTVKSFWDLFRMLADAQTVPASESLHVFAKFMDGVNEFVPTIDLVNQLLDSIGFIQGPEKTARARAAIDNISLLLKNAGDGVRDNIDWLVPMVKSILDLSIPYVYFLGSLAPAYDRLSGLLDRTSAAFPDDNGKVRLRVQLVMDAPPPDVMNSAPPGLAAALPAPAPGGQR